MIMRLDDLVIKFKSQNHGITKSLNHRITEFIGSTI